MRQLFCPICASPIAWRINEFRCTATETPFSAALGSAIKNAVFDVDAARTKPRAPMEAPYLWCPSCTAEVDGYDGRDKRMRCSVCPCTLPALHHFELMEIKEWHGPVLRKNAIQLGKAALGRAQNRTPWHDERWSPSRGSHSV